MPKEHQSQQLAGLQTLLLYPGGTREVLIAPP
jgi:hypothetical protein